MMVVTYQAELAVPGIVLYSGKGEFMARYALIKNGTVINCIEADKTFVDKISLLYDEIVSVKENAEKGGTYKDGAFVRAATSVKEPAVPSELDMIKTKLDALEVLIKDIQGKVGVKI